jgi:hypothetical protein
MNSLCSYSMIIFLVTNKPFKSNLGNFIEIFNEITLLLLLIICYLFTDFFEPLEMRETLGWLFIGIICFNTFVNLLLTVILMV